MRWASFPSLSTVTLPLQQISEDEDPTSSCRWSMAKRDLAVSTSWSPQLHWVHRNSHDLSLSSLLKIIII